VLRSGLEDLEASLPAFSEWLFSQVESQLGRTVLDAGAGVGTYSRLILESGRRAVALEPDDGIRAELVRRLGDADEFRVLKGDLADPAVVPRARDAGIDSAVCLNVLEHIEDDRGALRNLRAVLPSGGKLALLVPAHPVLFNSIDRAVGHFRRYRRKELVAKIEEAGLAIDRLFYFNFFAIPGWVLSGHILRRKVASRAGTRLFDTLVPLFKTLEKPLGGRLGMSLIALCRRP
jgi:SAM-dependent methyltransferase